MIHFPDNFVALRGLPGYFWNIREEHLWTMKVTGVLRPLSKQRPFYGSKFSCDEPYYSISHKGKRMTLRTSKISSLLIDPSTIPVQGRFGFMDR